MAEFRIRQFRYTWLGPWEAGINYRRDDVISYGGSTFVCIRTHTSNADFNNDLNFVFPGDTDPSSAWVKMLDGYNWRGIYQSDTIYSPGDLISYGGRLYYCVTNYTSGSIFDTGISNWIVFGVSTNWVSDWKISTRYGIGDLVKYGGVVYQCIEGHTSTSLTGNGLEFDQTKWQIYYQGIEFLGEYRQNYRYKKHDIVLYNGTLLECDIHHTSPSAGILSSNWLIKLHGFEFEEEWSESSYYGIGSVVKYGGILYICLEPNINQKPIDSVYQSNTVYWKVLSKGINFRGIWNSLDSYKTGDVVRRGGNLYTALLDIENDGSSLDYLDLSNWEILFEGQNWRGSWHENQTYGVNDIVVFLGNSYKCNTQHSSDDQNYPGDNGSGFDFWDLLIETVSEIGLSKRGQILSYGLSRQMANDGSTFGPAGVDLGLPGQLLTVNSDNDVIYKDYGQTDRVYHVSTDGIDDLTDPQRGISPFKPWKTIRFACEQADDGFEGTTTISVDTGVFEEILPIIVPARTVVLGSELRSTTIKPKQPIDALSIDSDYTIAILFRIFEIIPNIIIGLPTEKTQGNNEEQIISNEIGSLEIANQIKSLIQNIRDYIDFYVNSIGNAPEQTGSNDPVTSLEVINTINLLNLNRNFLAAEAIAYMGFFYPQYVFDAELCKRDIHRYIDAWIYDIQYTGNYKSLLAARYYKNAILGSVNEDMFYVRDATGIRNCTLSGLEGQLSPPNVFDLYRRPTGGAFVSLDPGWGPDDTRTWINTRSPYIQGVTTFGTACVGQKIDGALHNGGNKSIVSNDFTQVLSDGVGAWVANNGRAELVSVFTYYCQVGYLATDGGIIRATNGNNSYGRFGSISDGIDETEIPKSAVVYTRAQQAIVGQAFAGDFVDEIQTLEFLNAGENYTQASATFVGAGVNAAVKFEDFRDDAVFNIRIADANSTGLVTSIGGSGYSVIQGNAQANVVPGGDVNSITIASNDPNLESDYLGMRIIITSGVGTGQYGYITGYNINNKLVTVSRESDDQPGWDHIQSGKPLAILNTTTTYRIEPRVVLSEPRYLAETITVPTITSWSDVIYGETTETYTNITTQPGSGETIDITPIPAVVNVTKAGRSYTVTVVNGGAGYAVGQIITISGGDIGGTSPINDLNLEVTEISNDSTNSIINVVVKTYGTGETSLAASGRFVAISSGGSAALYSSDGVTWESFNMPSSGNWKSLAAGNNRFVAIRSGSNLAASSLDGKTWTSRILPANRLWNSVLYGDGVFLAVAGNLNSAAYSINGTTWSSVTMPLSDDSSFNEWVDIAYGKNKFLVLANSNNIVAEGTYNSTSNSWVWESHIMDVINDSSSKDWVSIAYGNNRFVAIAATGEIAWSFDGKDWYAGIMPTQDGSTRMNWKKIRYGQGIFFAICDTGGADIGNDPTIGPTVYAATSEDGIIWKSRELSSEEEWTSIAFGNPYIDSQDSTVGKKTPMWVAVTNNSSTFNKIVTGARAKARATVGSGVIGSFRIWDPGSGYHEPPTLTIIDPNKSKDVVVDIRLGDGVLSNPSWLNRGLGYRTSNTRVTITGDGYADVIPSGKFIVINDLETYPSPGAQILFQGNDTIYTLVTIQELGQTDRGLAARIRISPEIKVRDNLQHLTLVQIRSRYSQCRITGHDFLDIGTGNFEETNYPESYDTGLYTPAPENEIVEESGGRVFYTSTDQNGNFRTGELFGVEQATGIVTISADFFDLSGLTELRLGGIRVGGTGAVIREFSTDPLFTADSNNIVPTQRAIARYLSNRLTVGGSEIATSSFIAGTVLVGPDRIGNMAGLKVVIPVRADFESVKSGIRGSIMAQTMFYRPIR